MEKQNGKKVKSQTDTNTKDTKNAKDTKDTKDTENTKNTKKEEATAEVSNPKSNPKSKFSWKKVGLSLIPTGVVLAVYLLILVISGIKPFGDNSALRIDWLHQGMPSFAWLWDVLHGNASLIYSPLFGGGANVYGWVISGGAIIFCPIFYLIALFPRTAIDLGATFLFAMLLIYTVNIAFFVFKKLFKNVNKWYLLFFAVLWTFSPWVIIHSSVLVWHIVVGLFPLLLLSVKHLEDTGKITPFIVIYTYSLIVSFYISYMMLVALASVGFAYTLMIAKQKRKFASHLGFGLIFSLLLSFVSFWPGVTYGLSAYRFGDGVITEVLYQNFGSKLIALIMCPLLLVLVSFYFIRHFREDKKNARFFAVALGILCCGLVIERINAMWYTGSYYNYPQRYAFITTLALILISLYYINKFDWKKDFRPLEDKVLANVMLYSTIGFSVVLLSLFMVVQSWGGYHFAFHPCFTLPAQQTIFYVLISFFTIWTFTTFLKIQKDRTRNILVSGLSLFIIVAFAFSNFGLWYDKDNDKEGVRMDFLLQTMETDDFELPYRTKDKDVLFMPNYGVIIDYPSLSVWMGTHPANPTYAMRYMGYDEQGVWLNDAGGSIFTDMLMGNRYVISADENLNSVVYKKIKDYEFQGEKFYIYEYNFVLPFVQIVDGSVDIEKLNDTDIITAQNDLYKKFFGGDEIISKMTSGVSVEKVPSGDEQLRKITVTHSGELSNLYLHLDKHTEHGQFNAWRFDVADFNMEEYLGRDEYNVYLNDTGIAVGNGLCDLGVVENGVIEFYVSVEESEMFDNLYIAELPVSKLASISNSANNYKDFEYTNSGLQFTITGTAGQKVFIPQHHLQGASAKINGVSVDVNTALTAFISIDLVDGENNIEITFTPMNYRLGLTVTVISLVLLLILFLLNRFFRISDRKWAQWIGVGIGGVIFLAIAFLVFLKPFVLTIVTDIFRIGA
jgi:hypothetical protein